MAKLRHDIHVVEVEGNDFLEVHTATGHVLKIQFVQDDLGTEVTFTSIGRVFLDESYGKTEVTMILKEAQ